MIRVNSLVLRLLCFALIALVPGCGNENSYKGYTETDSGLYYKLYTIGEGKKLPAIGDFLQMSITYRNEKDSVFLDSYNANPTGMVILPFNRISFKGSFEEGLSMMTEGDSVSFIVSADSLFTRFFKTGLPLFLAPGSKVKMDVRLNRILNREAYEQEISRCSTLIEDRDIEEQRVLKSFLTVSTEGYREISGGMYYLPLRQGSGPLAEKGAAVRIHYKGYFLNGRMFESTYDRGQPLEFTIGEQGQVIAGLEQAITVMNEGAKAKFIIPSQLAYGAEGSSTGLIPPFTTVVYELELLNLNKHNP